METVDIESVLKGKFNAPSLLGAIEIICSKLLAESNNQEFPISLNNLTKFLKIKTKSNNSLQKDALLFIKNDHFTIEFKNSHNWRRQRFTIAHEIFHVVLFDIFSNIIDFNQTDLKKVEYICNLGASEILVPKSALIEDLKNQKISMNLINQMVEKYKVSRPVILRKINQTYPNKSIYIWRKYARKEKDNIEYRVFRAFQTYTKSLKYPYIPLGCTTKHLSIPQIFEQKLENPNFGEIEIDLNKDIKYQFYIEEIKHYNNDNQKIFKSDIVEVNDYLMTLTK